MRAMKTLGALFYLLLWSAAAFAQAISPPIPIYGHPELAAYTDRSQMPWDEGQLHWLSGQPFLSALANLGTGGTPGELPVGNPEFAHVHAGINCGRDRIVTGPFSCDIRIMSFNNPGDISGISAGMMRDGDKGDSNWVWEPSVTTMGGLLVTTLGHVTVNPSPVIRAGEDPITQHGAFRVAFEVLEHFPNGDDVAVSGVQSVYIMVDPSQPDSGGPGPIQATARVHSVAHPEHQYGVQILGIDGVVPLLLDRPVTVNNFGSLGYGAGFDFAPTTIQYRTGFDFHNGVPGIVRRIWTVTEDLNHQSITLDPTELGGPGIRKIGLMRSQPSPDEQMVLLLVTSTTVGPFVAPPPPTTCTDPRATNNGGPLPCVYPPPPPPVDVCPNIVGNQATVPAGFELINGACVPIPVPPQPATFLCSGTLIGNLVNGILTVTGGSQNCQQRP